MIAVPHAGKVATASATPAVTATPTARPIAAPFPKASASCPTRPQSTPPTACSTAPGACSTKCAAEPTSWTNPPNQLWWWPPLLPDVSPGEQVPSSVARGGGAPPSAYACVLTNVVMQTTASVDAKPRVNL